MKFIIDDANVEVIKEIWDLYPCDGVTTNPSILAKAGKPPYEVLKEIRAIIGSEAELHVQVTANTYEGMLDDAHRIIKELGSNTYVKVPTTPLGLKVMKQLHKEGIYITATAIYTAMQGYLAAKAGASYAAPYVNRIDNLGANGVETAKTIDDIFKTNNLPCEVLAASFKNSQQVLELTAYGIGASTIGTDVILGLIKHDCVGLAVEVFEKDFEGLCGTGKTMANI